MFSTLQILKSINFTVEEGQTIALLGDKGSGKSALIKLLQKIYDPQSGKVRLTENCNVVSTALCIRWIPVAVCFTKKAKFLVFSTSLLPLYVVAWCIVSTAFP